MEGKVKSPGGLTTDILQHPEKYQLDLGCVPSETERSTRIQIDLKVEEKKAEEAHQQKQEVLLPLTPQQQWEECRSTLKLLLNRLVTAEQWKLLEEKCLAGEIEAASLTRELTSLAAKGTRQERLNEYLTE